MRTISRPSSSHARRLVSSATEATTDTQGTRVPSQSRSKRWTVQFWHLCGSDGEQAVCVRCSRLPIMRWLSSGARVSSGRPPTIVQA